MTEAVFELALSVAPDDIDELGHVNNIIYLRWVQDVATAHWRALANPEDQAQWLWVVVRHEIDYLASAVLGDKLVVRTWVGDARGARFDRHVDICRVRDETILARARTTWALVDATTRRLARVPKTLIEQFRTGQNNENRKSL